MGIIVNIGENQKNIIKNESHNSNTNIITLYYYL